MTKTNRYYGQGFDAGLDGTSAAWNPYIRESKQHEDWNKGWEAGHAKRWR